MKTKLHKFHYKIGKSKEQTIETKTGVYLYAAAAIFGLSKVEPPTTIEIWNPELVKAGYGPYLYKVSYNDSLTIG